MTCGVYQFASPSGKRYIGGTINVASRWRSHINALRKGRHHSPQLQRAWRKYGEERITFSLLLICAKADLRFYEQLLLDNFKPEYNVAKDATRPMLGVNHSTESREKIGAASKRLWATDPVYRENMSKMTVELNKHRVVTPETREKIRANRIKFFEDHPEMRDARSVSGRAQRHGPVAKAKISAAAKEMWANNPKMKTKLAEDTAKRNKARVWTPEARAKMAETKSARYANDPALREKISQSVKGFKHSPEAREKIRAASIAMHAKRRAAQAKSEEIE